MNDELAERLRTWIDNYRKRRKLADTSLQSICEDHPKHGDIWIGLCKSSYYRTFVFVGNRAPSDGGADRLKNSRSHPQKRRYGFRRKSNSGAFGKISLAVG